LFVVRAYGHTYGAPVRSIGESFVQVCRACYVTQFTCISCVAWPGVRSVAIAIPIAKCIGLLPAAYIRAHTGRVYYRYSDDSYTFSLVCSVTFYAGLVAWRSGNAFHSVNEALLRVELILGWLTAHGQVNHLGM